MPARDRLEKSYVTTPHGQVHLRTAGRCGDPVLLLIHWTPLSGRMFAAVAPLFAAAGWRVLMPDLLGYGRSDARPAVWSVGDWADSLAALLDELTVEAAVVLGGHVGASVAVELALRHSARVGALVLDGCAMPTPELRAALAGLAAAPRPAGAGVATLAFDRAAGLMAEYVPGFDPVAGIETLWSVIIDYLETDFVASGTIVAAHDLPSRLALVTQPTLLLGASADSLAAAFDPARALLPRAAAHRFDGPDPVHFPDSAAEFAAPVLAFLREVA